MHGGYNNVVNIPTSQWNLKMCSSSNIQSCTYLQVDINFINKRAFINCKRIIPTSCILEWNSIVMILGSNLSQFGSIRKDFNTSWLLIHVQFRIV